MVVFWRRGVSFDGKNAHRAGSAAGTASTVSLLLQVVNVTQSVLSQEILSPDVEDGMEIRKLKVSDYVYEGGVLRGGGDEEVTCITPWKLDEVADDLQLDCTLVQLLKNPMFWQHPVSQVFRETLCHAPQFPKNVKIAIYEPLDGETKDDLKAIISRDPKIVFPHEPQEEAHEISLVEWENEIVVSVEDEVESVEKWIGSRFNFLDAEKWIGCRFNFLDAVAAGLGLLHWKRKLLGDEHWRVSELQEKLHKQAKMITLRKKDSALGNHYCRSLVSEQLRKLVACPTACKVDISHVPKETFLWHWKNIVPFPHRSRSSPAKSTKGSDPRGIAHSIERPASRPGPADTTTVFSSTETDYSVEGPVSKRPRRPAGKTAVCWVRERAEGSAPRRLRRLVDTTVDSSPSKRKK